MEELAFCVVETRITSSPSAASLLSRFEERNLFKIFSYSNWVVIAGEVSFWKGGLKFETKSFNFLAQTDDAQRPKLSKDSAKWFMAEVTVMIIECSHFCCLHSRLGPRPQTSSIKEKKLIACFKSLNTWKIIADWIIDMSLRLTCILFVYLCDSDETTHSVCHADA